jgi:hypothetical protein
LTLIEFLDLPAAGSFLRRKQKQDAPRRCGEETKTNPKEKTARNNAKKVGGSITRVEPGAFPYFYSLSVSARDPSGRQSSRQGVKQAAEELDCCGDP